MAGMCHFYLHIFRTRAPHKKPLIRRGAPNKPTAPVAPRYIEGGCLDSVPDGEFVTPRKFLHREHEPREELIVRLYGGAHAPGMIVHLADPTPKKQRNQGLRPWTPEVKI
jgi:hypothetical protein